MSDEQERGKIAFEQAYALSKMLDHSSWLKGDPKLPRRITGSDIDIPGINMVFDNDGAIIFGELSRGNTSWNGVHHGQRWVYESLIRGTHHCAVLCHHAVDPSQHIAINTRFDIDAFQIMIDDGGPVYSRALSSNARWQNFVFSWMKDKVSPIEVRRRILGYSVGMVKPRSSNVVPIPAQRKPL